MKDLKSKKLGLIGLIVLISAAILLGRIIASALVEITIKPYRVFGVIDLNAAGGH